MYKLEYYSKSRPDQVRTHESLNATELQLVNLTPDTDYVVQLVAYAASQTSEPSARHFRTLANDLEAPRGLEVIRFEPDKISVQWEAAPPGTVKAYKIYFKEVQSGGGGANSDDEYEGEGDEASDEWNVIVHNETIITDTILKGYFNFFNWKICVIFLLHSKINVPVYDLLFLIHLIVPKLNY